MKRTLITLGAVLGFSAGAFAQGYVNIITPSTAGFNSASSNPADTGPSGTYGDFFSGNVTLEIFTLPAAGNLSLVQALDSDAGSAATEQAAVALLTTDGFTQQGFTAQANGVSAEQMSEVVGISGGEFAKSVQGINLVGTSTSIGATTDYFIALLATAAPGVLGSSEYQGVLALDAVPGGYTMGTLTQPNTMSTDWGNNQNLLLAPVPEPTTLALAGLGGLSMLFLRRRKA